MNNKQAKRLRKQVGGCKEDIEYKPQFRIVNKVPTQTGARVCIGQRSDYLKLKKEYKCN